MCSTVLIIWILTYSEYRLQVGANLHKCLNGFFTFSAQMDSKKKYKLQSVRLGPQCEFVLVKSENCPFGQFCVRVSELLIKLAHRNEPILSPHWMWRLRI